MGPFGDPVRLAGVIVSGCDLRIDKVVPYPGGVELQPLVERLAAFPKPQAWSVYLRRALLALPSADAKLLDEALRPLLAARQQPIRDIRQPVWQPEADGPACDLRRLRFLLGRVGYEDADPLPTDKLA